MRFHYTAAQADGKVVEGDHDATTPLEALSFLGSQGLRPISLKASSDLAALKKSAIFGQTISLVDKVFLTKYLGLMLKVGTDLFRAIDILIADFDKPVVKALLMEIRSSLEKGQPFYSTFAKYPRFFSPVFINLIKAGEASGSLERVFEDLTTNLEKDKDLQNRIRAAFVYPIILMVLAFIILIFLVTFALPKIANIFQGGSFKPPIFSRIVFAVGLFLNAHIIETLIAIVVLAVGGVFFIFKTDKGRSFSSWLTRTLPVVKGLTRKIALQRFATTLGSLMKAGLPIVEAIEITADAVGNEETANGLRRVAREGVAKGLTIGEAFRKEAIFPAVVSNLIAISEKAGHLESILKTLADFYEADVDNEVKTVVSFIEPVMLLGIGLLVGLIALSIIVPIYQLVGQLS